MPSNILNVFKPELWSSITLDALFPRMPLAGIVNRSFSAELANQGDTVHTRIPGTFTAADFDETNFVASDVNATDVPIVMNKHKHVTFSLSDKERSLSLPNLIEIYAVPAAEAIAQVVETELVEQIALLTASVGAAGVPNNTVALLCTDVKEKFDGMFIPRGDRYIALNGKDENYFNQLFYQAFVSGDASQQTTGELGTKFGMRYVGSDLLATGLSAGFSKNAIALASRQLAVPTAPGAAVYTDQFNGIGMRASVWYNPEKMRTYVRLDLLFGTKLISQARGFKIVS